VLKGLIFQRLNFKKQEVIIEVTKIFNQDFLYKDWNEEQKEAYLKNKSVEKNLNYNIKEVKLLDNGNVIGILENFDFSTSLITTQQGFNSTSSSPVFKYGDLIIYKISSLGEIEWIQKITKNQEVSLYDNNTSIACSLIKNEALIFFNDNKNNYNENGLWNGKNISMAGDLFKSILVKVAINLDSGDFERSKFLEFKNLKIWPQPKMFTFNEFDNNMLLVMKIGKKEKYGSFQF
jgi:hypothetical protein